jgi:hypothetical protein
MSKVTIDKSITLCLDHEILERAGEALVSIKKTYGVQSYDETCDGLLTLLLIRRMQMDNPDDVARLFRQIGNKDPSPEPPKTIPPIIRPARVNLSELDQVD